MKNKLVAITLTAIFGFAVAASAVAASADDAKPAKTLPPDSAKTGVTYAADIKPIFAASCVKCHSGPKPHGHLKLDTLEGVLKGSHDGPVVIPGKSDKSDLVLAVAHMSDDDHDWMPPIHGKMIVKPLTPEQIGLIRAWIDQGAK